MATIKTCLVAVGCGVLLLGAVSAHAGEFVNGTEINGFTSNGTILQGLMTNGMAMNGFGNQGLLIKETRREGGPTSAVQSESLPFNGLSQRGLGKTNPQPQSVHTRFVHLTTRESLYCALARAASVPMLCGLI